MNAEHSAAGRVLLIEAVLDERAMYAVALRHQGYSVFESEDGHSGLEEARRSSPDVVVADLVLPRLDGLGLVNALQAHNLTRDIPVIILASSDHPPGALDTVRAAGASIVRLKPFLPQGLLADVRDAYLRSVRLRERVSQAHQRARDARAASLAAVARAARAMSTKCPACAAELEAVGPPRPLDGRVYYRPCKNGCGWWNFDATTRRLYKLM